MSSARSATSTVKFVDDYCKHHRDLFSDVRSYKYFTLLHIGLWSALPWKTLPALGKALGLKDGQGLHHLVVDGDWKLSALRNQRLELLKEALGERNFVLCIDETRDPKKGTTIDYAARQYLGKLGKVEPDMVRSMRMAYWIPSPFHSCFRFSNRSGVYNQR